MGTVATSLGSVHLARGGVAVQLDVHEHQVEFAGFGILQTLDGVIAVVCGIDRKARVLQNCLRDLLIEKIVLNQKDLLTLETVLRAAIAFSFLFT